MRVLMLLNIVHMFHMLVGACICPYMCIYICRCVYTYIHELMRNYGIEGLYQFWRNSGNIANEQIPKTPIPKKIEDQTHQ